MAGSSQINEIFEIRYTFAIEDMFKEMRLKRENSLQQTIPTYLNGIFSFTESVITVNDNMHVYNMKMNSDIFTHTYTAEQ